MDIGPASPATRPDSGPEHYRSQMVIRQAVTVLRVHHRPGKSRVAGWAEVAVIASLDTEREPDAEGPEHIGCERSQRNHRFLSVQWALRGIDAPLRVSTVQ